MSPLWLAPVIFVWLTGSPALALGSCDANGAAPPDYLITGDTLVNPIDLDTECPGPPAGSASAEVEAGEIYDHFGSDFAITSSGSGVAWTFTNNGYIRAGSGTLDFATGGHTVINSGDIVGLGWQFSSLTPRGTIELGGDNTLNNLATGTIYGKVVNSGALQLSNAGSIGGAFFGDAIEAGAGSDITNLAGATISSSSFALHGLGDFDLSNAGTISGTTAVKADGAASITNLAGGLINGTTSGIVADGALTVGNAGQLTGGIGNGITANSTANVTNEAGGVISGRLAIEAASSLTLDNSGTLTGSYINAVVMNGGGTITNRSGGSIVSTFPTYFLDRYAVHVPTGQTATIINESGATIHGIGGIGGGGQLNIINAGLIRARTYGGTAGWFGIRGSNLDDTLELRQGYAFDTTGINAVMFGGTDTLRLGGSGADSFDASQVGSRYASFEKFEKIGSSNWTLTGNATAAIGWDLIDGTLTVGQAGALGANGSVTMTGGVLDINDQDAFVGRLSGNTGTVDLGSGSLAIGGNGSSSIFSGTILGTGSLVKAGAGTLTLGGANSFSGGVEVQAGTLRLETNSAAGTGGITTLGSVIDYAGGLNITNGIVIGSDTTQLQVTSGSVVQSGDISQTGGARPLEKTGAGTLTLSGNNSFGGLLTISDGTVRLLNGSAIDDSAGVAVAAGATLGVLDHETVGSLSGSGSVALSSSALTVGADNTDTIFSGLLSGSGTLTKEGTGAFTLTGANTFTGPTTVAAGKLVNTGSLTSGVTVNGGSFVNNGSVGSLVAVTGGIYAGNGTAAGLSVTGGRVAPGNSIGTLVVNGALNLGAGATYQVEVDAAGNSDQIEVNGTVTLGGGGLSVLAAGGGDYSATTDYLIIANDRADAIDGTFGTVNTDLAFLTPIVNYRGGTGNDVVLTLARNDIGFAAVGLTYNQTQSADALEGFDRTSGTDSASVYSEILKMSPTQAGYAFDLASGEVHASAQQMGDALFDDLRHTLNAQGKSGLAALHGRPAAAVALGYVETPDPDADKAHDRVRAAWTSALGGTGRADSDGNAAALNWWSTGMAGGYQGEGYAGTGRFVAGVAGGYVHGGGSVPARLSNIEADSLSLGVYGAWSNSTWTASGSAAYAATRFQTTRGLAFGAISRTAEAGYWAHSLGITLEAARKLDFGSVTLSPLVTVDAGWSGHGGANEIGAGALNLAIAAREHGWIDGGLGLAVGHRFTTRGGRTFTTDVRAVWEHGFVSTAASQTLSFAGNPATFDVRGPAIGRDRLRVGVGIGIERGRTAFRTRYDGTFFGARQRHSGTMNLTIRF